MSEVQLGRWPDERKKRDAIHIAVIPIIAPVPLHAGQRVNAKGEPATDDTSVGIVDPFLWCDVPAGFRFWLLLDPGTITALRHEWIHPAFEGAKAVSEEWLRNFCETHDCPSYEVTLAAAIGGDVGTISKEYDDITYTNDGEYLHFNGRNAHSRIPPEFWHHVEVVSDKKIPWEKRPEKFSCSC